MGGSGACTGSGWERDTAEARAADGVKRAGCATGARSLTSQRHIVGCESINGAAVTGDSKAVLGINSGAWWAARGAAQPWDWDWAAEIVQCALMGVFFFFFDLIELRNHLWARFFACIYRNHLWAIQW